MTVQIYLGSLSSLFIIVLFVSVFATFMVTKKEFNDKVKLDIDFEQMIESERKIDEFLNKYNLQAGVSIEKVAEILNVKQGGTEQGICSQACLKENSETGEKVVYFKEGLCEEERKFAFVHEIAHILNGDRVPATRPSGRNKSQVEQLADYTAAALLMPRDSVFDFLTKNNYLEATAKRRMALVRQLCKDYEVTEMIVLRRIKEVYVLNGSTE